MCLKWDLPTKNFHGISKGNENEKKTEAKGRFGVRLACSSDKFNFPLERQSRFTPSPLPNNPLSSPFQCVWLMAPACWRHRRQQSNRNHKGVLPKHKHKRADPPWTKGCPLLSRVHFPWTGQKRMSSGDKNYKAHAIFTPTPSPTPAKPLRPLGALKRGSCCCCCSDWVNHNIKWDKQTHTHSHRQSCFSCVCLCFQSLKVKNS